MSTEPTIHYEILASVNGVMRLVDRCRDLKAARKNFKHYAEKHSHVYLKRITTTETVVKAQP